MLGYNVSVPHYVPRRWSRHKAKIAYAEVHVMANAGHAPFRDDAVAFNRLRAFAERL